MAVSEMVIASTLMEGSAASRHLARWHPDETIRSVQLYGVRPDSVDWACRCTRLSRMHRIEHIALCSPVRPVVEHC